MLFVAFEKKWWKALIGDQDAMVDEKNTYSKMDLQEDNMSSEEVQEEVQEIEQAVLMTSAKEWKEGEEFIENAERNYSSNDDPDSDEDEDNDSEGEVYVNAPSEYSDYAEEGTFDFDGKEIEDDYYEEEEEKPKARDDIQSVKEFFNSEVLYRFDILDDQRRTDLIGRYRIEVRGDKGGVWTLDLSQNKIDVTPQREEADLVLMLHSDDFISIVNGELNPQIALVSQRVKVSGDSKKASLFQNIMSPLNEW